MGQMKLSFELRRCSEQALNPTLWPGTVPWKWESLHRLKPFSSDFNSDFNAETLSTAETLWGSQASSVPVPGAAETIHRERLNDRVIEFQMFQAFASQKGLDFGRSYGNTRCTYTQYHSINEFTEKNSAGMDEPPKLKCGWAGAFAWNCNKSWFMSGNKPVEWPGQRWDGSIWDEARRGFLQHRHQHLCKIWSSSRGQSHRLEMCTFQGSSCHIWKENWHSLTIFPKTAR